MPSADFCGTVERNRFPSSHDFVTCRRSPEVSSTAFDAQPPDLPPVSLMDVGFAILCSLARHRRPRIRFLFIGSRLCSTLLSGPASRRVLFHPCASLSLHVHHVVKRTCTSKLSNMLGTHKKAPASAGARQEKSIRAATCCPKFPWPQTPGDWPPRVWCAPPPGPQPPLHSVRGAWAPSHLRLP